nr:MAG TPA: protein of unknown function DUF3310 [Caudoviricetes sp.]
MNYYENEHGKDLRAFLIKESLEDWAVFCFVNAMKYNIRAGKKPNESLIKDLNKRDDYMEDYIIATGLKSWEAYEELREATEVFYKYDN